MTSLGLGHNELNRAMVIFQLPAQEFNGYAGLILGLRPANEIRRYFVTTSLIGWAQT